MSTDPNNLTPIHDFGEFRLIDHLTDNFQSKQNSVLKAVGDDAAVIKMGDGKVQVVSTDMLLEGVHFDLRYVPMKHLGYKSVAVNVSDIFAMNARPYGITVSVAMSNRFTVEAMEAFYDGVKVACDEYGVDLLGGDTASSMTGLVVSVTALGIGDEEKITYRNGAKENDLIVVSGDVGAAYAGLQILEREKQVFLKNPEFQPDLDQFSYVVGRQLKPEARVGVIDILEKQEIVPTSMIDVSDGLASEIFHICSKSNLGAMIYEEKIPIDHQTMEVAEQFQIAASTFALNGGEDYELLFTVSLDDFEKIQKISDIHVIGHVTDKAAGVRMVTRGGTMVDLEAQGWKHFGKSEDK